MLRSVLHQLQALRNRLHQQRARKPSHGAPPHGNYGWLSFAAALVYVVMMGVLVSLI